MLVCHFSWISHDRFAFSLTSINLLLTHASWQARSLLLEADRTHVCECYIRLNDGSVSVCTSFLRLTSRQRFDLPPRMFPAGRRWRALSHHPGNRFPCRQSRRWWPSLCCTGTWPTPGETHSPCSGWLDRHICDGSVEYNIFMSKNIFL